MTTPSPGDLYRNRKTGQLRAVTSVKISCGEPFIRIGGILTTMDGLEEWYEPVTLNLVPGFVLPSLYEVVALGQWRT